MLVIKNRRIFLETIAEAVKRTFIKSGSEQIENRIRQIAHAVREIETNPFLSYDRRTRTLRTISRENLTAYKNRAGDACRRADGNLCPAKALVITRSRGGFTSFTSKPNRRRKPTEF